MSLVTDSNSCPCPLPANIVYVNPTKGGCTNKNIFRTIQKAVRYTDTHIPLMQTVIITLYPGTYILDETVRIVRPQLVIQAFTVGTAIIQGSFLVSDELYPSGISSRVQFDGLSFTDPSSGIICDMVAGSDAERSIILSNSTFTTTTKPFEGSVVNLTTGDAAGLRTQLLLKNVVITEDILSTDDPTVHAPLIITQPATSDADYATGSLSIVGSLITANSVRPLISAFAPYKLTVTDSKTVSQIERQEAEDTYVISARFPRPNLATGCTISVSNTTISSRSTSGLLVQHEFESTDTPTVNLMDSMFDVSYFYPIRATGRFNSIRLQRIMAFGIAPKTSVSVVAVPPAPPSDLFPVLVFDTKILDCNLSDGGSAIEVLDGVGLTGRRLVLTAQENGIKARTTILELDQVTINSAGSCIFLDGSLLNQSTNCTLTSLGSRSAAIELTRESYAVLVGGSIIAPRGFRFAQEYVQTGFNILELVQLNVNRALIESRALQDVAVTIRGCTSSGYNNFGVNTQPNTELNLIVNLDNSLIANVNTQGQVKITGR